MMRSFSSIVVTAHREFGKYVHELIHIWRLVYGE